MVRWRSPPLYPKIPKGFSGNSPSVGYCPIKRIARKFGMWRVYRGYLHCLFSLFFLQNMVSSAWTVAVSGFFFMLLDSFLQVLIDGVDLAEFNWDVFFKILKSRAPTAGTQIYTLFLPMLTFWARSQLLPLCWSGFLDSMGMPVAWILL